MRDNPISQTTAWLSPTTEPRGCPTPGACSAVEEIVRLRALVTELADDLEAEINARYPEAWREYPSEQRRYERDMEPVRRARATTSRSPS